MTFNQSSIPSSTMSNKNVVSVFNSKSFDSHFNTIVGYFHTNDGFFGEIVRKNTIAPSSLMKDHIPFDDLYWDSDTVNSDHALDGITLDEVYPSQGSIWDGCTAEWDFDGTYSVESAIPVSTSVRTAEVIEVIGRFDENTSFFNQNEYFYGNVPMAKRDISSSSFTQYNNDLTVNMIQRTVNDSSMTERIINA